LVLLLCFSTIVIIFRSEILQLKRDKKVLHEKVLNLIETGTASPDVIKRWISRPPQLSSKEIQYLKKRGLKDPVNDIAEDLMKHNEFIPYRGIVGGKMQFFEVYVISTRLVRAYFEDGHIGGWMMLEYRVNKGGRISWEVLESYLN